jgi:hypothetical protein
MSWHRCGPGTTYLDADALWGLPRYRENVPTQDGVWDPWTRTPTVPDLLYLNLSAFAVAETEDLLELRIPYCLLRAKPYFSRSV